MGTKAKYKTAPKTQNKIKYLWETKFVFNYTKKIITAKGDNMIRKWLPCLAFGFKDASVHWKVAKPAVMQKSTISFIEFSAEQLYVIHEWGSDTVSTIYYSLTLPTRIWSGQEHGQRDDLTLHGKNRQHLVYHLANAICRIWNLWKRIILSTCSSFRWCIY